MLARVRNRVVTRRDLDAGCTRACDPKQSWAALRTKRERFRLRRNPKVTFRWWYLRPIFRLRSAIVEGKASLREHRCGLIVRGSDAFP